MIDKGTRVLVTGGAGFVGSHLIDRLLSLGAIVTCYDNGSTGQQPFLHDAHLNRNFMFVQGDIFDVSRLGYAMAHQEVVFHLAANADVRSGTSHPGFDFKQNVQATQTVLEAMRLKRVKTICFASSGTVYGYQTQLPIREDCPFPIQTSFYGASKVAAEGLIGAYVEGFSFKALIYRFVPMIGERYSHGHIFDFVKKLLKERDSIEVLGTGQEQKYCVYIQDAISGMLTAMQSDKPFDVFNIGNSDCYTIDQVVDWVAQDMGITTPPTKRYTNANWAGDNPQLFLDCTKLKQYGWTPAVSIRQAVQKTVQYLIDNPWLLERP